MSTELTKIDFHGDNIIAFKDESTEKIYVNIREICALFGIDFSSQRKKIVSDSVYENALVREDITTSFGIKESLFLESEYLHGWLFSIQTNRLRSEIREKHTQYKRECFKVLNDYFTKGMAINPKVLDVLTERVDKIETKLSKSLSPRQQKNRLRREKVRTGILEAVSGGERSTKQLYDVFNRHIDAGTLHAMLNQLIQEGVICARILFALGRGKPTTLYAHQILPRLTVIGK